MEEEENILEQNLRKEDDLKPIPISNNEDEYGSKKGIPWIFGFLVAIFFGSFGGVRSHSQKESVIYAGMFLIESLVCLITANVIPFISFRQSGKRIAFFILIQAISCFLAFNLPDNIKDYF